MNVIAFEVRPSGHAPGIGEVRILVDGRDLRDLVRLVESNQPESGDIAGRYAGLPAHDEILPPSAHFLGSPSDAYRFDARTQVLGCDCGEPGCWPLVCRIEAGPDVVVWRDFEQPHRSAGTESIVTWSYERLGPFRFARAQYDAALSALRERPRENVPMTSDDAIRLAEAAARDLGFPWNPAGVRARRRRAWPFPATWLVVSTGSSPPARTAMRVSERSREAVPAVLLYPAAAARRPISWASALRFALVAAIGGTAAYAAARWILGWPVWACALLAGGWALVAPVISVGIRHDRAADLDPK